MPERILLVGNSYTNGVDAVFKTMAEKTNPGIVIESITPGGSTLHRHLKKPETVGKVRSGKWNIVVLQEQSQAPTLAGSHQDMFFDSVKEFCSIIREQDAQPLLYQTWGRRDGDEHHARTNPDYITMQDNLIAAYEQAGRENEVEVIPAGRIWSRVRKQHPAIGIRLYHEDGSHPSPMGHWMIACIFMKFILHAALDSIPRNEHVAEEDAAVLRSCIQDIMQ